MASILLWKMSRSGSLTGLSESPGLSNCIAFQKYASVAQDGQR
jgi:hypothetical protein